MLAMLITAASFAGLSYAVPRQRKMHMPQEKSIHPRQNSSLTVHPASAVDPQVFFPQGNAGMAVPFE